MGWIQAGFGQGSGGKRVLLRELCARNDFKTIADPSRIEGNIDKRETFKVWEVGTTFLALSQRCTAETPLYASLHSRGAALCVRSSSQLTFVGLDRIILIPHVQTLKTLICGTVVHLCSVVLESVGPLQLKKSNETLG